MPARSTIVIDRLAASPMPPAIHHYSPCQQCVYTEDGPSEWGA
jgi:hypothetical protein